MILPLFMKSSSAKKQPHSNGLRVIAYFKWIKGALLIALAIGVLKLLHRDVSDVIERFTDKLPIDPNSPYLDALFTKARHLNDRKLEILSGLTFLYGALFLTEGTGLFLEKRWAEYLTIIATASFVPLEIYELVKEMSAAKWITLVVNVAIAIYLIVNLRRTKSA